MKMIMMQYPLVLRNVEYPAQENGYLHSTLYRAASSHALENVL